MNFLTNLSRHDPAEPEAGEVSAFEREIEAAYAVSTPPLTWEAAIATARRAEPDRTRSRGRVRAGLLVAGLAVAAVAVAVPLAPGRGGTGTVSAEELIERSEEASVGLANGSTTYHMVVEHSAGEGNIMRTETWQDGPNRTRQETTSSGDKGGWSFGQISDGETVWLYSVYPSGTRAVKIASELAPGFATVAPEGSKSLADAITGLVVPGCQEASRAGKSTLLGRTVYVVEVKATGNPCGSPEEVKASGGKLLHVESTVYIDAETYVVLRSEQRDLDHGSTYVMAVTTFETEMAIPEGTFTYVAPAGVTVIEATDVFSLKTALAEPYGASTTGESKEPASTFAVADPANEPAGKTPPAADGKLAH